MKLDLSQFRVVFMQESAEHVVAMEAGLLSLSAAPSDLEILNAIFRSAHSIKGGAGSFGMHHLVRFTHALENLLDRLRSLEMPATEEVIGLLLQSVDVLRGLLALGEAETADAAAMPPRAIQLLTQIETLTSTVVGAYPDQAAPLTSSISHLQAPGSIPSLVQSFQVEFHPARTMFTSGTNPIVLLRNLAALGTVTACVLHTDELPSLAAFDVEQCYLHWTVSLQTAHSEVELREVFEFVEHLAEVAIHPACPTSSADIRNCADARELAMQTALPQLAMVPSLSQGGSGALAPNLLIDNAVDPRIAPDRRTPKKPAPAESSSIRVATGKVDRLIDLVGELVIAHVMTAQMVARFDPECLPKLREAVAAMERNTRELHESVMGIRMMPVGSLFQRYARTVYDIAQATGKQIRLETTGEETEIDKSMLELLGDPLTHLIRNSADHGIETAEIRRAAGKPEQGSIQLRACHRAGRIVIEIVDDGAGIDTDRVRAKAVKAGLIAADAQLSEEQLRTLIFEPGFSTRDEVSDLSGRGVGMDVVKRNIQQLNGTVAVASEKGNGSTVTIELPLTLAILEGLLVRVANRTLVLPLLSVVETIVPSNGSVVRIAEQGEVVLIRGESIPLLYLATFLGVDRQAGDTQVSRAAANALDCRLVVVAEAGRRKIGLVIDELLGQQQVVVKSLERHLRKIDGLMGATILGDGSVAPIVDVVALAGLNLFSLRIPAVNPSSSYPAVPITSIRPGQALMKSSQLPNSTF